MAAAFTARERQIIPYLARGWESKRIAEAIGVSWRTVEEAIYTLAAKIPNPDGIRPKTNATIWCVKHELHAATAAGEQR